MMHYQQNLSLSNDFRHFCALGVLNNRCLVGVTAITCYFTEVSAETFSGSLHLLPLASVLDPLWLPMKSWCVWLNRKRVIGQHFLSKFCCRWFVASPFNTNCLCQFQLKILLVLKKNLQALISGLRQQHFSVKVLSVERNWKTL